MTVNEVLVTVTAAVVAMGTLSVPLGLLGNAFSAMKWGWAKRVGMALEGLGSNVKQVAQAFKPTPKPDVAPVTPRSGEQS